MEFITSTVEQLNWWAILLATLSTLPVGYLWYDLKVGFGKKWAKLNDLKVKDLEAGEGMASTFAVMLVTSLATAFMLACLIKATGVEGFWDSLLFGLIFGIIFRGGAHFIHNGFTRKPMELTLLDAGHDMASLTVMALILGLWQ
jgi:hypothetical protein